MAPLGLQQRHLEGRTRNLLFKRAGLSSSVELRAWGQQRAGPCVAARFPSCRVGAMWSALHGPGRAKDSARTRGWLLRKLPSRWVGGRGKVCCRRLAGRSQKPERAEGVQLVNAIYTMYKLVISPLSGQRPHQVQAPRQGTGHRGEGRAGLSNTFLALKGKRGGSADGASRYKKRGENSLNNGTKLRLSPESLRGLRLGRVQCSLCWGWGISSSVSFVYCFW